MNKSYHFLTAVILILFLFYHYNGIPPISISLTEFLNWLFGIRTDFILPILFGIFFPDIDTVHVAGKNLHRKAFHSFFTITLILYLLSEVFASESLVFFFFMAIILHWLGDIVSDQGVAFLYPLYQEMYGGFGWLHRRDKNSNIKNTRGNIKNDIIAIFISVGWSLAVIKLIEVLGI